MLFPKTDFPKIFWLLFAFALLVYALGAFLQLMEPDATSYALVSAEMYDRGEPWIITLRGYDWLDKPHFQFWVTFISYHIFGVNDFAYRLPSLLLFMMGVWYTYLYTKRFYSHTTGLAAVLVLMSAFHIIVSNSDVRAETLLTGFTIFSLYYMAVYLEEKRWQDLILGCLGMGIMLMTKGLYTVLPIAGGIGLACIYRLDYKEIFHPRWLFVGILAIVFTLPTLLSYYIQFDLHPEKEFFGQKGVSGVRFFLWDSQWGRFTNTGPIKGEGEPTFFLHSLLWAFAPWSLLAYWALIRKGRALFQKKPDRKEPYTFFAFVSLFLIFSISSFQLPHYMNILYPFLAILTADAMMELKSAVWLRAWGIFQAVVAFLFFMTIGLFQYLFNGFWFYWDTTILLLLTFGGAVYFFLQSETQWMKIIIPSALAILMTGYFLNRDFYPRLLPYQSETQVAFYIQSQKPEGKLGIYQMLERSTDFYLRQTPPDWNLDQLKSPEVVGNLVFTDEKGRGEIQQAGIKFEIVKSFDDFPVTQLKPQFINRKTRKEALKKTFLLRILQVVQEN
ncbi:MAG: glycosyltransferase family 39 protein [Microscillaceae bacterium]|nr:glycosyltransferase family 39 protein [Microscillaceae bacterium]